MDADQKKRLAWVKFSLKSNDAGLTCTRCGISRPTLRKWLKRYEANGMSGLSSQSSRPLFSPIRKLTSEGEQQIISLRTRRNTGARRIHIELGLVDDEWLSRTLIQRVLDRAMVVPLKKAR